jgi:CDI immunity protein
MQRASIFIKEKEEVIIVYSVSQTTAGLGTASEPFFRLKKNIEPEELIEKIRQALDSSKKGIPHPKDWKNEQELYLQKMGYKSLKQLNKNAKLCDVRLENNQLIFLPYKYVGKNAFSAQSKSEIKINISESTDKIYCVLEEAISRCK